MKPDIFFVRCFNDGSYEELLLKEVKTIHSISGCDLQQLVNYVLPTFAKQGNVLGLFLTANNAMLVKLGKKEMENKMVIVIWRGPSGAYRKARENELAVV